MKKHTKITFLFLVLIFVLVLVGCDTMSLMSAAKKIGYSRTEENKKTYNQENIDTLESQIKKKIKELQEKEEIQEMKGIQEENSLSDLDSKSDDQEQGQNSSSDIVSPKEEFSKHIYLTFDDGPSEITGEILDILKKYDIKATFFVNGGTMDSNDLYSKMIKRISDEGHALGNHGYNHDYRVSYASKKDFKDNVDKLSQKLEEITGVKPNLYRFQGGSSNTVYKRHLKDATMKDLFELIETEGFKYFDWNVDARDSEQDTPSAERTLKYVLEGIQDKSDAIVLMHDSEDKRQTPKAVELIIEKLQQEGYGFDKLSMDSFNFQHKK